MTSTRFGAVARSLATRRTVLAGSAGLATAAMVNRAAAQDATPATCPDRSAAEMQAQVRALVDAWNARDFEELERLFHPDHAHRWNGGAEPLDRDSYLAAMETMWDAFDDLTFTADHIITLGDVAVLRFSMSGMQIQEFDGFPPGERPATWTAIMILTFRCGLIVEAWAEANHLGRLRQQGSIPMPDGSTPAA